MIYLIRLEFLKSRYTTEMHAAIMGDLLRNGIEASIIEGDDAKAQIQDGKVLDAAGTIQFKAEQWKQIAEKFRKGSIKPHSKFFLYDLEFGGAEFIRYMSTLLNIPTEIYGFLHASSTTREDFTECMQDWMRPLELGWIKACDKVFVGSNYFAQKLQRHMRREGFEQNLQIMATGNVFKREFFTDTKFKVDRTAERPYDVIFPNRFDREKGAVEFLDLVETLPEVNFLVVTGREVLSGDQELTRAATVVSLRNKNLSIKTGLTKSEYYKYLQLSKLFLSLSHEENFGYCTLEAMAHGCFPVVPKAYSYPELVPNSYSWTHPFFVNLTEVQQIIQTHLVHYQLGALHIEKRKKLLDATKQYEYSFLRMLREMGYAVQTPKDYQRLVPASFNSHVGDSWRWGR